MKKKSHVHPLGKDQDFLHKICLLKASVYFYFMKISMLQNVQQLEHAIMCSLDPGTDPNIKSQVITMYFID
jgi:hypothetical protein